MAFQTYTFTSPSEYIYNSSLLEVSSGVRFVPINNPGQDFTVNFESDTGKSYDSSLVNFNGTLAHQVDKRPANATFYASYTNNENASWSSGTGLGSIFGSASVIGGALVIPAGTNNYVQYSASNNIGPGNTGTIVMRIKPKYSGSPGINEYIFAASSGENNINNLVRIMHIGSTIRLDLYDSSGVNIITSQTGNTFTPVADTVYEIAFSYNTTTGAARYFLDGVITGGVKTFTPATRNLTSGLIRIGKDYTSAPNTTANIEILDIIIYDTEKYISNYTPDWTNVYETIYLESTITCEELQWAGVGTLISFDSFTSIVGGSTRFSLQIGQSGNYLYFDGAAWSVSDGSYSQATSTADFSTYGNQLPVTGEVYGQFKVHFPGTNTQSTITTFTASLTAQKYSTGEPAIVPTDDLIVDSIDDLSATADSQIKFICEVNDDKLYYSSGWIASDGSYAQSNTIDEIVANSSTLISTASSFRLFSVFDGDGQTQLELSNITIYYSSAVLSTEFVVEDGSGKTDSTSYTTVVQFLQYWKNKGINFEQTDEEIKQWLNLATEYIDNEYNFFGYISNNDQALKWPRSSCPTNKDIYGYEYYDTDIVPNPVINATCYVAGQIENSPLYQTAKNLKSITIGPLSKTFSGEQTTQIFSVVNKYFRNMVTSPDIVRVN